MSYTTIATANPSGGLLSTTINLSGSTDIPNVSSWLWDYDDGSPTATGQVTSHQYSSAGTYNPFVIASNNIVGPTGIYLDTYIVDDFGDAVGVSGFDPGWDNTFVSYNEIGDCSGFYAYEPDTGNSIISPSGAPSTLISGNFDLQLNFTCGCTNGGNTSLHFYLRDSGGVEVHELGWHDRLEYNGVDVGFADDGYSSGRRYTVRMIRGYKLTTSGTITAGHPQEIRSYYLDNWSGGASNEWREFASSPESGVAEAVPVYVDLNGATYNGYDNLIFQADYGLPYSGAGISPSVLGSGSAVVTISGLEYPVSGYVAGKGYVYGDRQIIYKATPAPPSGSAIGTYTPILMNKRRYVYKIGRDYLQTKLMIYKGKHLQYLPNLDAELWLNYQGAWQKYEDYTTNRYGMAHMKHSTDGIPDIDCCLGIARVTINGQVYNSNIVRFNFVEGVLGTYNIDAGSCSEVIVDRSSYDIFDGSGRANTYDRMWRL